MKKAVKKSKASRKKTSSSKKRKANTASKDPRVRVVAREEDDTIENIPRTKIRVIGIGGGGGNIVAEIASRVQKADYIVANTDEQALHEMPRKVKTFSFGTDLTEGLGCGMNPQKGEQAAKSEKDRIKKIFEGQDISIIIASLGGGTGSGATPVFAELAKEYKNLTIGIFTMPFPFEGEKRRKIAEESLEKIKASLNAYSVIPNERIFFVIDKDTPLKQSFSAVNTRLADTLEGLIETISTAGLINIDFADVRATLEGKGKLAYVHSAEASGPSKIQQALGDVLLNPLYDYGISGVERMLFNIKGDRNMKMHEVAEISKTISDHNPKAKIVFGIFCTPRMKDSVRIALFAVGCQGPSQSMSRHSAEKKAAKEFAGVDEGEEAPQKKQAAKSSKKMSSKKAKSSQPAEKSAGFLPKPEERKEEIVSSVPQFKPPARQETPAYAKTASQSQSRQPEDEGQARVRRNALDVRKAVDEEIKELEEKEKKWDIPAFLRNK